MKKVNEEVSILLDREIWGILKKLSVDKRTSLKRIVNSILRDYCKRHCTKDGMLMENLEEVYA